MTPIHDQLRCLVPTTSVKWIAVELESLSHIDRLIDITAQLQHHLELDFMSNLYLRKCHLAIQSEIFLFLICLPSGVSEGFVIQNVM